MDTGELKMVDVVPTPWPCFTAAVLTDTIEGENDRSAQLCSVLAALDEATIQFKANQDGVSLVRVQEEFNLNTADATAWFCGEEAIKQPEVCFTDNHGGESIGGGSCVLSAVITACDCIVGKPTLSRQMMEDCRALLIDSGVLPAADGEARDVGSYCAGFTTLVD